MFGGPNINLTTQGEIGQTFCLRRLPSMRTRNNPSRTFCSFPIDWSLGGVVVIVVVDVAAVVLFQKWETPNDKNWWDVVRSIPDPEKYLAAPKMQTT